LYRKQQNHVNSDAKVLDFWRTRFTLTLHRSTRV